MCVCVWNRERGKKLRERKKEREKEKREVYFKEKRNACNINTWTKKGEREKGIIPIRIQCKQHTLLGMKLHYFIVVNFL